MKVCAISFKECWQGEDGKWYSNGGFPLQMEYIASLFDEMTLIITKGPMQSGGLLLPERARIIPLRKPKGENTIRKLDVIQHIYYYIKNIQIYIKEADVIHTPLPGDIPLIAMLVAIFNRKYLIARYGGSWETNTQTTLVNRFTRGTMRAFAGGKNIMLATGHGSVPPAPRMKWIFSTALKDSYINAVKPNLNRDLSTPPQLVYIGRLSPEKGVKILIQAVSILKQKNITPLPKITLIGDGPERTELQIMVEELNCNNVITFAGQLNRDELSAMLLRMDICIQPSLTEGYSKAWLDAMAHGLPVVASKVGAARSVIGYDGERGWLTDPGDAEMLSRLLQELLSQSYDWSSMRTRCRKFAESRTLEQWAHQIGKYCSAQWDVEYSNGKLHAIKS